MQQGVPPGALQRGAAQGDEQPEQPSQLRLGGQDPARPLKPEAGKEGRVHHRRAHQPSLSGYM